MKNAIENPNGKVLFTQCIVQRKKFIKSQKQNAMIWTKSNIETNEFYAAMQLDDGKTANATGDSMYEAFTKMLRVFNQKYAVS